VTSQTKGIQRKLQQVQ